MNGGRPTKLTPEVQERIIQAIRTGNTRKDAAAYAGITDRTLSQWMRKGRKRDSKYRQFLLALKKADADAAVRNVAVIQKATQGGTVIERRTIRKKDGTEEVVEKYSEPQWTAAAWWLERRRREDFGRHDRIDHGNAEGKPFKLYTSEGGENGFNPDAA